MRALVQPQFGDPSEVLSVQEVPDPQPGPGQALVRVLLSPIHNHDLWTAWGSYGFKPEMPARAGTEAVGVVEALGEGVEGLQVGQRVATGGSFDNGLPFSLSMGCGTWGGNSISDNLGYRHFLNITRVVTPLAPERVSEPSEADLFGAYRARHGA